MEWSGRGEIIYIPLATICPEPGQYHYKKEFSHSEGTYALLKQLGPRWIAIQVKITHFWMDFRSTIMDGFSVQITCNICGGRVFDPNVSEVLDGFSFQLMSKSTVFEDDRSTIAYLDHKRRSISLKSKMLILSVWQVSATTQRIKL